MARTYTDNYSSTHAAIVARILGSNVARDLRPYDVEALKAYADGTKTISYGYISLEFRRADSYVTFYVRCDSVDWDDSRLDAEGNQWSCHHVTTEASWPSHGSTSSGIALCRLNFYTQVALLAAEIEAEFGGRNQVWRMTRTATEIAEAKAKKEAALVHERVSAAIDSVRKGMRVGGSQYVLLDFVKDIPDGEYVHTFGDGKRFKLVVKRVVSPEVSGTVAVGACFRLPEESSANNVAG